MVIQQLIKMNPALEKDVKDMPPNISDRLLVKKYKKGSLVQQKNTKIEYFGIVVLGEIRLISEFQNGTIKWIENNKSICYVGEVALLAGETHTSVTITAETDCTIAYLPIDSFYYWIGVDNHFLQILVKNVAQKLYFTSYFHGEINYHSSKFTVLKYIQQQTKKHEITEDGMTIEKTRKQISEEIGMSLKTLNRNIAFLKENKIIEIYKGKIHVTKGGYQSFQTALNQYQQQSKNGQMV